MTGSTSRATKGNVTNTVASTMPGTAKMMWMSLSASHGPSHPCRPKSRTKTSPAMTGETLKGRSMSVRSTSLAGEVELGDEPRGGEPEDQVERHGDRRRSAA